MPHLAEKEYCTGCTACASVCPKGCISMVADGEGFLIPVVDAQTCVACGMCEKACPVLQPLSSQYDLPRAYAAYSRDEAVRMESSSGGVFTELAKAVLKENGAVFGAAYDDKFEVTHICVECESDLAKLRGAKYAQSSLTNVFPEVKARLNQGQNVLFSGTPCQVGGLKAYLRKDYGNLLTVDFVCHSVPSPMAWKEYVKYRAQKDSGGSLPEKINLRSKITGWSRYQYSNVFTYANGKEHAARSGESLYMKLFVGGYINRKSCETCRFKGYSRVSDLTIGDFWGIWDITPEMDDDKGTSVVLVQSQQGRQIIERLEDRLSLKRVTLEDASRQNGAMLKPMHSNARRTEALQMIRNGSMADCEIWFAERKLTMRQRAGRVIKQILRRGRHV